MPVTPEKVWRLMSRTATTEQEEGVTAATQVNVTVNGGGTPARSTPALLLVHFLREQGR